MNAKNSDFTCCFSDLSISQLFNRKQYLDDFLYSFNKIKADFDLTLQETGYQAVSDIYDAICDELQMRQR